MKITITNDITYHEAKNRLERLINNSIDSTSLFTIFDIEDDTKFEAYINSLMNHVDITYNISKEELNYELNNINLGKINYDMYRVSGNLYNEINSQSDICENKNIEKFNPNLKREITTQTYENFKTFYDTAFGLNNFVGI